MKNLEPDISSTTPIWGLQCVITPRLGTRLIQQGRRLHFLADRAGLIGTFTPEAIKALDVAFPLLIEKLEALLRSGELDPRSQHSVTVQHAGFTCEADTLGSFDYVHITVYQATRPELICSTSIEHLVKGRYVFKNLVDYAQVGRILCEKMKEEQ